MKSNAFKFVVALSIILNVSFLFQVKEPSKSTVSTVSSGLNEFPPKFKSGSFVTNLNEIFSTYFKDSFENVNVNDTQKLQELAKALLPELVNFVIRPHVIPINEPCMPPPLQTPPQFPCKKLPIPRKVGVLLQFGFDVDALEIHLNELDELVDKFFIIESIESHSKVVKRKPLIWDLIKDDERFAKFSSKIVHFIVDDAEISNRKPEKDGNKTLTEFQSELHQERLRWMKFLQWNNGTNYFKESDLLGFGDVDEIPDRNNIFFMKNCELKGEQIDIGIWFPFGDLNTIFRSDFPVKGHPYTLGDPTYFTLRNALNYSVKNPEKFPTRMRGRSPYFLLGGLHLSNLAYPPFQLIDYLTGSEVNLQEILKPLKYYMNSADDEVIPYVNVPQGIKWKIKNLDKFREKKKTKAEADLIVKMPWFLDCNRRRYPYIEWRHDTRLD